MNPFETGRLAYRLGVPKDGIQNNSLLLPWERDAWASGWLWESLYARRRQLAA
jgi:hypothetical protein